MTFNRFAGLGTLHAFRTLVFRSRTAWLRRFQGRERDVRDESAPVVLGGAGRVSRPSSLWRPTKSAWMFGRRQCCGKSLYKTQSACIEVRETV